MYRGTWRAIVHKVILIQTQLQRLSLHAYKRCFKLFWPESDTQVLLTDHQLNYIGSLVGCYLWGCTELDTTKVAQQQQQQLTCKRACKIKAAYGTYSEHCHCDKQSLSSFLPIVNVFSKETTQSPVHGLPPSQSPGCRLASPSRLENFELNTQEIITCPAPCPKCQ